MNKKIKSVFTIITLSLITLLTGCNSEGAFNSNGISNPDEGATLVEIAISPSPVLLAHRNIQQLTAIGKYDDGTEGDISNSSEWEIVVGDSSIATLSSTGLVTAGTTLDDVKVVATKDGIPSEEVTVTVSDLAGPVIDIFDTGSGKLFTNSPSKAYLDSIGGSAINGTFTEGGGNYGPAGVFYLFDWTNANALCDTYNAHSLGGRTNWRLATSDELGTELYIAFGHMSVARDWPSYYTYWSVTPNGSTGYWQVPLYSGGGVDAPPNIATYASCVSNP
ncbi:DUF1566 domain-containing protein [Vibrio rhodolitus]|uniref:DUF1566 domain-containing protein n=1 Tax=Vibrio rhodolitus TaxID=2231649 RepID=UPI000E0A9C95|nr:DUF1566 domain-containing protein [Vibrio rhodolitus]